MELSGEGQDLERDVGAKGVCDGPFRLVFLMALPFSEFFVKLDD